LTGRLCPEEFLTLGHRLADAARPFAEHYFRQTHGLTLKSDTTPVTLADNEIEQAWRKIIMQEYPDHGIWGEEFGRHQPDAEYQWILDPIDGTKAFTLGRTSFGCLIALHHKTQGFILGICDQPITKERWVGACGIPTTYNGVALSARKMPPPDAPLRVGITNPVRFNQSLQQCHDALSRQKTVIAYGGDCMNFTGIASGLVDVSFENNQSIYDIAPFVPILKGVGAVITQHDGKPITLDMGDGILAAATPELHRIFLALAQA
jgi:inositol-phosphate phosphatase/L-galactose 1-phosphate phosphatase/histidinol-phosphatase